MEMENANMLPFDTSLRIEGMEELALDFDDPQVQG